MPVDDFPDRATRLAAAGVLPPAATDDDGDALPPDAEGPTRFRAALLGSGSGDGPRALAEHVPIRLDPALQRRLEARAAADGTSPSDVVRRALQAFLDDP